MLLVILGDGSDIFLASPRVGLGLIALAEGIELVTHAVKATAGQQQAAVRL